MGVGRCMNLIHALDEDFGLLKSFTLACLGMAVAEWSLNAALSIIEVCGEQ